MAHRAVKTERTFPELKATIRLTMYPEGEKHVRVTEARRQRVTRAEGTSQWKRARELEQVWLEEKMGLTPETTEALAALRERMERKNA